MKFPKVTPLNVTLILSTINFIIYIWTMYLISQYQNHVNKATAGDSSNIAALVTRQAKINLTLIFLILPLVSIGAVWYMKKNNFSINNQYLVGVAANAWGLMLFLTSYI